MFRVLVCCRTGAYVVSKEGKQQLSDYAGAPCDKILNDLAWDDIETFCAMYSQLPDQMIICTKPPQVFKRHVPSPRAFTLCKSSKESHGKKTQVFCCVCGAELTDYSGCVRGNGAPFVHFDDYNMCAHHDHVPPRMIQVSDL